MGLLPPPPAKHKAVLLGGGALLMCLVLGAIFGDRGFVDLQRLRAQQRRLEQMAFRQQQANAQRRDHIQRLRADDRYLERWARQRLRWAKPGEIIYRFPDARPHAPRPPGVEPQGSVNPHTAKSLDQ